MQTRDGRQQPENLGIDSSLQQRRAFLANHENRLRASERDLARGGKIDRCVPIGVVFTLVI
jgi:hypothetical protein